MLIQLHGVLLDVHSTYTTGMSDEPQPCPSCHRMSCFFTNKNGQTTCTACSETRKGVAQ